MEFELHLLNLASPLTFQTMLYNTYLDTFDVHYQYYILDMEQPVGHAQHSCNIIAYFCQHCLFMCTTLQIMTLISCCYLKYWLTKKKHQKNNGMPIAPFGSKNKNKVLIKPFGRFSSQLITLDQHLLLWPNK